VKHKKKNEQEEEEQGRKRTKRHGDDDTVEVDDRRSPLEALHSRLQCRHRSRPLPSLSPSLLCRSDQCSYVVCKDHHTNEKYCVFGLNWAMRHWQKFLAVFFFGMQFLLNSCHGEAVLA
jgi:hypothetical protein